MRSGRYWLQQTIERSAWGSEASARMRNVRVSFAASAVEKRSAPLFASSWKATGTHAATSHTRTAVSPGLRPRSAHFTLTVSAGRATSSGFSTTTVFPPAGGDIVVRATSWSTAVRYTSMLPRALFAVEMTQRPSPLKCGCGSGWRRLSCDSGMSAGRVA